MQNKSHLQKPVIFCYCIVTVLLYYTVMFLLYVGPNVIQGGRPWQQSQDSHVTSPVDVSPAILGLHYWLADSPQEDSDRLHKQLSDAHIRYTQLLGAATPPTPPPVRCCGAGRCYWWPLSSLYWHSVQRLCKCCTTGTSEVRVGAMLS